MHVVMWMVQLDPDEVGWRLDKRLERAGQLSLTQRGGVYHRSAAHGIPPSVKDRRRRLVRPFPAPGSSVASALCLPRVPYQTSTLSLLRRASLVHSIGVFNCPCVLGWVLCFHVVVVVHSIGAGSVPSKPAPAGSALAL